jgi:hypothetical protein
MPLADGLAARQELSRLNSEIAGAIADRDEAQRQVARLETPTALLAEVTHEYAVAKAAHDAMVVAWYQGGAIGSRPAPSPAMLELERRIGELHQDVGASGDALQGARSALAARNARLATLAAEKASAHSRATAEAAAERLSDRAIPALTTGLVELSVIQGIAVVLAELGRNDPEARSEARALEERIAAARQSIGVKPDLDAARAWIAALAGDPNLPVPDPVGAEVVRLEPRALRPLEDGTKFLNRGEPEPPTKPTFSTEFGQPEGWAFVPPRGAAA